MCYVPSGNTPLTHKPRNPTMRRNQFRYVRERFDDLGVSTFMQKKEVELLARYLLPDEEILAALSGTYAECGDDPTSLPTSSRKAGFIVLTARHIIFAGKASFGGEHTARMPHDDVSHFVLFSEPVVSLLIRCETSPSFRIDNAGGLGVVTEFANTFARLTDKPKIDTEKELPRDTPDYTRLRLTQLGFQGLNLDASDFADKLSRALQDDEAILYAITGVYHLGASLQTVSTDRRLLVFKSDGIDMEYSLDRVGSVQYAPERMGGTFTISVTNAPDVQMREVSEKSREEFTRVLRRTRPTEPIPVDSPGESHDTTQAGPPQAPDNSKPASTDATPATPKTRQTSTALSSSGKSQPGEGKASGCLAIVVLIVIIAVIVGVISDACSGDDSGSDPDDRSLSPVQQGALRDAKTYGLDAIAAANGISDTRLADLMVRETAYVLHALERFAGNRQRYDIVWGSCYNRDIHTHRPRVLQSGLATYCGDFVDRLR